MSVKKQRRILPRCSGVTSDRSQCGRRVADGSNPPLCHIHAAIARGQAANALTDMGDEIDEIKILKRLARDSNPQVRLRAVDSLLDLKRRHKEQGTEGSALDGRMFLNALLPDERELVRSLLEQLNALKQIVYEREPKLRPAGWGSVVDVPAVVPEASTVEEVAPPPSAQPEPEVEDDDVLFL